MPDASIIPMGEPICLQATDPARNIARRYTILVQRDFFGAITVDYSWDGSAVWGDLVGSPSLIVTRPSVLRANSWLDVRARDSGSAFPTGFAEIRTVNES